MSNKQFALAGLWMTAIVFAAITLVTYHMTSTTMAPWKWAFPLYFTVRVTA